MPLCGGVKVVIYNEIRKEKGLLRMFEQSVREIHVFLSVFSNLATAIRCYGLHFQDWQARCYRVAASYFDIDNLK